MASAEGVSNLTLAEAAIVRSKEVLKASQRYLETEGADALQRAIQRSEKFGQQSERMSQIARDSRQAVDELEETATMIETTAQEALNTSTNAYVLARNAVDQQKNTTEDINRITKEVMWYNQSLLKTKELAKQALMNAQSVFSEALSLLGDAYSLVVPKVEWQFMKTQSGQYSDEARRIKLVAEQLLEEHMVVLDEAKLEISSASELLTKGDGQQQIADELLVDADAALAKSQDAVSLGDKTLQEAQKTLETLEGNDNEPNLRYDSPT